MSEEHLREIGAILADSNRFPVRLVASQGLVGVGLEIALEFGRSVYDALYLAAAVEADADFVTADERLVNAMSSSPFWHQRLLLV